MFFHILGIIIPTDYFFSGGSTNRCLIHLIYWAAFISVISRWIRSPISDSCPMIWRSVCFLCGAALSSLFFFCGSLDIWQDVLKINFNVDFKDVPSLNCLNLFVLMHVLRLILIHFTRPVSTCQQEITRNWKVQHVQHLKAWWFAMLYRKSVITSVNWDILAVCLPLKLSFYDRMGWSTVGGCKILHLVDGQNRVIVSWEIQLFTLW